MISNWVHIFDNISWNWHPWSIIDYCIIYYCLSSTRISDDCYIWPQCCCCRRSKGSISMSQEVIWQVMTTGHFGWNLPIRKVFESQFILSFRTWPGKIGNHQDTNKQTTFIRIIEIIACIIQSLQPMIHSLWVIWYDSYRMTHWLSLNDSGPEKCYNETKSGKIFVIVSIAWDFEIFYTIIWKIAQPWNFLSVDVLVWDMCSWNG